MDAKSANAILEAIQSRSTLLIGIGLNFFFSLVGSRGVECDVVTGKCECRSLAFAGLRCDRCAENHFNFTLGCQPCEDCYNLVQAEVESMRARLHGVDSKLDSVVRDTMTEQARVQSRQVESTLKRLKTELDDMHVKFFTNSGKFAFYHP